MPNSFKRKNRKNIRELLNPKKKDKRRIGINGIEDLILDQELEHCGKKLDDYEMISVNTMYTYLNSESITDNRVITYENDIAIAIIEFRDKDALKLNIPNIKDCMNEHREDHFDVRAIIKEEYAIFIHTMIGKYYERKEIMDIYKNDFDFKELKVD